MFATHFYVAKSHSNSVWEDALLCICIHNAYLIVALHDLSIFVHCLNTLYTM